MHIDESHFVARLARTEAEIRAAQALRYEVFVAELGGDGAGVDHDARLETDGFDPLCDHLLLLDQRRAEDPLDCVVGVYRLMPGARLAPDQPFYTEGEFDLSPLRASGRSLLELGRSCLHAEYRGGTGMLHLWRALARYVEAAQIDLLFGTASFHGTDPAALAAPLSLLHYRHLAPEALRVRARPYHPIALVPEAQLDRPAAMRATPALIKAYLRLGGFIGDGVFVDHAFNTTDVCLVMDTDRLSAAHRAIYAEARSAP